MVRSGWYPLRTTRCRSRSSFSSRWRVTNSATSSSTACCNNSRAPCRNTSVNASATGSAIPGFRYSTMVGFLCSTALSSCTAYSSLAIRLMVRRKTHQEYATFFIRPYTTFELNSYDSTLDRSYQYDQVGALVISHSGAEARASAFSGQWGIMDGPYSQGYDYDKSGNMTRRYGWGGGVQGGAAGQSSDIFYNYTNNKKQRDGFRYDPAGTLPHDLTQPSSYAPPSQPAPAHPPTYFSHHA